MGPSHVSYMQMEPKTLTSRFARFWSELQPESVPSDVRQVARWLLLDTIGCIAAALRTGPAQQIASVGELFGGADAVAEAGVKKPQGVARAAYVNARLANLLDFDETYPVGVHFGVGAVAAAIAGVQAANGNFSDLLIATVAGYEAGARLASAIGPMMSVSDGEVTGFSQVWGVAAPVVVAACVAYGRALGLDSQQMVQALGIAGSNIPLPIGSKWSGAEHLPDVKYCDAGWCTVAGIHAVQSVQAGLTGFDDILDGISGIPEAYSATMPNHGLMQDGLGERWHLRDITFKPWPSCRFMHAPLTALERLINREEIRADEVEEVVIETGPLADSARFRNAAPRTFAGHQFSYAHNCAMLLMRVPPGPGWFDMEIATSPLAMALRAKVLIKRAEFANSFAKHMVNNQIRVMPGAATVRTTRGEWTLRSDYADGDPWDETTRYDEKRVLDKFLTANPDISAKNFSRWLLEVDAASPLNTLDEYLRELAKS
ncbi:hypothetical protein DF141_27775 [Burkholderia cenocepacia]|nr:hypothetical protein DF141_27775 [Burkholderia cenocepacia]RQZ83539.1 hypothetical protein DF058_33400 [Burkholderia cenocepacia]RRA04045.1 hypothetical protein DF059_33550 [Burkholderia cenocepacia]